MRIRAAAVLAVALAAIPAFGDLDSIRNEPDPERRARLALDCAGLALDAAKKAYFENDDLTRTKSALDELGQAVELAYSSLEATGRNARKHPKHFIEAEIRTRELERRLNDFSERMSAFDRDLAADARQKVRQVHDGLLGAIMGQKKKRD
ncbi:MAG: hypothetical protein ABSG25_15155 [Bryobacteraceae bacterium]